MVFTLKKCPHVISLVRKNIEHIYFVFSNDSAHKGLITNNQLEMDIQSAIYVKSYFTYWMHNCDFWCVMKASHSIETNTFIVAHWQVCCLKSWCWLHFLAVHYNDVIMGAIASQITSLMIVYSNIYSDADQRKHQSSASLAFLWGIHRGPVNFPHKWPVMQKMFPVDDVIMAIKHLYCLVW